MRRVVRFSTLGLPFSSYQGRNYMIQILAKSCVLSQSDALLISDVRNSKFTNPRSLYIQAIMILKGKRKKEKGKREIDFFVALEA